MKTKNAVDAQGNPTIVRADIIFSEFVYYLIGDSNVFLICMLTD